VSGVIVGVGVGTGVGVVPAGGEVPAGVAGNVFVKFAPQYGHFAMFGLAAPVPITFLQTEQRHVGTTVRFWFEFGFGFVGWGVVG
jgi:hypothetical protein